MAPPSSSSTIWQTPVTSSADLGNEGKWAEDFRDDKVRPMQAGNETILPGADCAVREGYELVGWYITDRGTNTRGTNSVQVADDLLAHGGSGLFALGGLFVMPELANDSELLTQIGDNYFYTLHAIWRATDATYSVEVWVQNADGTLQRVEVRTPGRRCQWCSEVYLRRYHRLQRSY